MMIEAIEAEAVDITHTPQPGGSYSAAGLWVEATPAPVTIRAAVQPLTGRDLSDLPEGLRTAAKYKIYTPATVSVGDHVTIGGTAHRVLNVSPWPEYCRAFVGADQ
jgi:hypothetical protein